MCVFLKGFFSCLATGDMRSILRGGAQQQPVLTRTPIPTRRSHEASNWPWQAISTDDTIFAALNDMVFYTSDLWGYGPDNKELRAKPSLHSRLDARDCICALRDSAHPGLACHVVLRREASSPSRADAAKPSCRL